MEIRESATYPYPIWGIHDSFIGDRPVPGKRELVSNNETNTLDVKYEVLAHNSGVDRLIEEGKAAYKYIVECPQTYYLKHEEFQTGQFVISIPYGKVFNRVSIKVVVVATIDINGCDYLEVDEIYEGAVDYPKGAVVAYLDEFAIPLQQRNNTSDLSKIVTIMPTDVSRVENVLNMKRIIIKIPQGYAQRYNNVEDLCPGVIESSLVFNALVEGIYSLREEVDETKDWVFYLKQYVKECQENGVINNDDESLELDLKDIYTVVENLLDNPQLNAIDDAQKIIDQMS